MKHLSSHSCRPSIHPSWINAYLWDARETLGYNFYNREENKVSVACNGVFLDKGFLSQKASWTMVRLKEIQEPLEDDSTGDEIVPVLVREPVVETTPEPRRSDRLRRVRDVLLL